MGSKRTSQKEITTIYLKDGIDSVRALLNRFPGANQTFIKVIDSLRESGKDVAELEDLQVELYGTPREYVDAYDEDDLGSGAQISEALGISQGKVYIVARARGVEPEAYLRSASGKGKGTALYNREQFAAELALYEQAQKERFADTYDSNVLVTSDDVLGMFDLAWGLDKLHVSGLLTLAGVKCVGKYRPAENNRGGGKKLYSRAQVEAAMAGLRQIREEVNNLKS